MFVQRVVMPVTEAVSWTVLGDDGDAVAPVESYLAYLAALERSPNTQRAYATSLKLWFEFLAGTDVDWDEAGVDDVARFVSWLRAPAANVIVFETGTAARAPATVNRHLAAVFGFYDHHARWGGGGRRAGGVAPVGRGSYKPFLHHVTKGRPIPTRPVKLPVPRRAPPTLTPRRSSPCWRRCEHVRGTGSCWRCWPRPACGSAKPWGCATPISSAGPKRCASCPAPTTPTGRGRSSARRRPSR